MKVMTKVLVVAQGFVTVVRAVEVVVAVPMIGIEMVVETVVTVTRWMSEGFRGEALIEVPTAMQVVKR